MKKQVFQKSKDNSPIHSLHLRHFRTHLKQELRGVWITTAKNTDFPSPAVFESGKFDLAAYKREFLSILKRCKDLKLNAIFFQVRPQGDAFYPSGLNPWSQYLTGRQGVEPGDGFDPLAWMIDAAHLDGIEFHAWLNPFRLTPATIRGQSKTSCLSLLSAGHYVRENPHWAYFFNGGLTLDAGCPEVASFLVATVQEIIDRYDVDGIHLDDYFYPYSYEMEENGEFKNISFLEAAPDLQTFEAYKQVGQPIEKWRENNVNRLIEGLYQTISIQNKKQGTSIAFGVSPFGVWASASEVRGGSFTSPDQLSSLEEFVNSKLWVDQGWVDYIVPQNYWGQNDLLSPFKNVASWWDQAVAGKKTQLYMGLGPYLYESDAQNPDWQREEELLEQVHFLRTLPCHNGYACFTFHHLNGQDKDNEILFRAVQKLKTGACGYYALVPPREHLQTGPTEAVVNLKVAPDEEGGNVLFFEDSPTSLSRFYVIYRHEGTGDSPDLENPANILDVVGKNSRSHRQSYMDTSAVLGQSYTYAITALSRAQVESKPMFAYI